MSTAHTFTDYQQRALAYAIPRRRIALFMEMRLGKSSVSVRWAKARHARRVLLVAPLSTLLGQLNWVGELKREGIDPTVLPNIPTRERMGVIRPATLLRDMARRWRLQRRWAKGWFCVNYEALRTQPELLAAPWDAIILDESTRIRNPKAQITKLLTNRTDHIPMRALLSGLPNPEDSIDYFSQFKFLHGHFMNFDNYWAFKQTYYYTRYTNWDWAPKPGKLAKIQAYVQDNSFLLSRKQAGVGSKKFREQLTVQLNTAQRKLLKEIKRDFSADGEETKWIPVTHTWMQRVAGGFHPVTKAMISDAKIRLAEDLLVNRFRNESVVMWFRFNEEIEAMYRWLRKRHKTMKVEYVHGAMKDSKKVRGPAQDRFQSGKTRVLLLQVALGKFGWALAKSSTAIYYSNSYEFEDRSQSEDRIVHLTKKAPCLYLDLVTEGTPDEEVVASLADKRYNAKVFNSRLRSATKKYMRAA